MHESHQEEHPRHWEHQKQSCITKLFDRCLSKRAGLWNNKEISTTLTAPGSARTTLRRKIYSKIIRKTSVKKLENKCGCVKQ